VKHLNPRQGITTLSIGNFEIFPAIFSVKHLNPRQGITTQRKLRVVLPLAIRV